MKPVDHVNPTAPANWVRRIEDRKRRKDPNAHGGNPDPGKGGEDRDQKRRPGQDPDGRTHLIDELA